MAKTEPITFALSEPVEIGEGDKKRMFKELVFSRRMKGKDLLAMDAVTGELRKSFALYASMAGVPITVFGEMDADDFTKMALEVAPLMGKGGKAALLGALEKVDASEGESQAGG